MLNEQNNSRFVDLGLLMGSIVKCACTLSWLSVCSEDIQYAKLIPFQNNNMLCSLISVFKLALNPFRGNKSFILFSNEF